MDNFKKHFIGQVFYTFLGKKESCVYFAAKMAAAKGLVETK